jgi:hypothetical protein
MPSHSGPTDLGCAVIAGFFGLWLVYLCAVLACVVGAAILIWKHI